MNAAVIPVFNPEPGLESLCTELARAFAPVVVVDDGSVTAREAFEALPSSVTILRHARNCGKGCALKTALAWLLEHARECPAVVFADGDGQHALADVRAVAQQAEMTDRITLGVRDFRLGRVPFLSWWGNTWTSLEVRLILGLSVRDTQTGLRAVPRRLWRDLLSIPGDRFEYEAGLFPFVRARGEILEQLPIRTIYRLPLHARVSHFRPWTDTLLTQCALFRSHKRVKI